jgi:ABC transporter substrate binding protein (PQQ-dependent alcohol dehydrogenase system)
MTKVRAALVLTAMIIGGSSAQSQSASQNAVPEPRRITIGYVALEQDERYDATRARLRLANHASGPPAPVARAAIDEAAPTASAINVALSLREAVGQSPDELAAAVENWLGEGIGFVVADLPRPALTTLADRFAGKPVMLLNATAPDDALRGPDCRSNVVHVIPSVSMQAHALMQFLVRKRWRNILLLSGPTPEDEQTAIAVTRSAKRFGGNIVAHKRFQLTNDPRQRELGNISLLTTGPDHDVIYLVDKDGEFARDAPYAVNRPRPVVGSAGLTASAWHWAWDSHGARQLNTRFEKALGRLPEAQDWAVWAAVRLVTQAVLRTGSVEFDALMDFILSDRVSLDGYKGAPMSVRAWDQQLRQPMLLATANSIVERAPIPGFMHQTSALDTLGLDAAETPCRFERRSGR